MIKKVLVCLMLMVTFVSLACINEYRTKLDGTVYETMPRTGVVWFKEIDSVQVSQDANELLLLYEQTDSIEYLSDYAAKLVYLGEFEKAKNIYFKIESEQPNLYTTASNLGTIYELIGQPDSALFWIRKSIDLNPQSHNGSEWIHIKILEFQLSKSDDFSVSILGLDFGSEVTPVNKDNIDLKELERDIRHQLHERLQFVHPKNKIVGNIYFDLGNTLALYDNLEAAIESYQEAKKFGFESEIMDARIEEFESLTWKAETKTEVIEFARENRNGVFFAILIAIICLPILFIWFIYRYKRNRKS